MGYWGLDKQRSPMGGDEGDNVNELRTCPFCGSEAEITHDPMFGSDNPTEYYRVQCKNKDCSMGNPDALFDSKEQIIEEWNTRPYE